MATPRFDTERSRPGGMRVLLAGNLWDDLIHRLSDRFDRLSTETTGRAASIMTLRPAVATSAAMEEAFAAMLATADPLDIVVCRFGEIGRHWLDEMDDAQWHAGLRHNGWPAWRLGQWCVPLLQRRAGSFVALTSRAAQETLAGGGAHGTGKVLESMLLRNLAVEARPLGVRVNLVRTSPDGPLAGGERESADEVADTIAFLASPASRAITAAIVPVDAGTAVAASTPAQFGLAPRTPPPATARAGLPPRQRALVTGGAGQIGSETARALHRQARRDGHQGLAVLLADRDPAALSRASARLTTEGIEVECAVADLLDPAAPARLVSTAVDRFGGLDVVHSNAALGINDTALAADADAFERIVTINVDATWRLARAAAAHLRQSGGSLIATSSIAALAANARAPLYAATKAALSALVMQLAQEWARLGIRANVICPGSIDTPMNQLSALPAEARDAIVASFPTPRLGTAAEVAAAAAFLASAGASYITGQIIVVDGGLAAALR